MNLFNDQTDDLPTIDPSKDPLEVLTGPGGKFDRTKYASEEEMYKAIAKGKLEGDMYIDHFKQRHDELKSDYTRLREEYNAGPRLKEIIDQMSSGQQHQHSITPLANDDKAPIDESKLADIISSKLTEYEQTKKEEANARLVESKLIEHFGPNYQSALKQQVEQLGLDKDFVNGLARKHPQVLFKTLGIDQPRQREDFQSPPPSSQRFAPQVGNERTWSYYQKLRQTDPVAYRTPKIQDQMFKDAARLGDAFQDGDWKQLGH